MIDSLDLTRHAVFEASAGTGKTYTIMQLTLRLLRERHCTLDEILIVTFTEKATGELKDRLRRELEAAIDREPAHAARLRSQLDRLDRAAISTIHGFCKRLLQDQAANLGQDFQADVVMEPPLRIEALRETQRKDWHAHFGVRLPETLRAADFGANENWEKKVREICDKYRPEAGHQLIDDGSLRSSLVAFSVERVRERIAELKRERGIICFDDQIERVASGLDPAINPLANNVIDAVRRQYRFAIVDEFQDTDPRQWDIFRRLFLTDSTMARPLGAEGLLDAAETPPRLIVVGDPKQAIYGFRGADLPTYQRAIGEMIKEWNAAEFPLAVNWRSSPELIAGLNHFFSASEFFPADGTITYTAVAAPPVDQRRASIVHDTSGRPPITIVDVNGPPKSRASTSRLAFARFTAREIDRLLHGNDGNPHMVIKTKTETRPLRAGDICVLVYKHAEANPIKSALARRRIPYSHYKAVGVRRTPEARDLKIVLKALAHPDDAGAFTRTLLTMFFRIPPCDLLASEALPAEHPARLLFDHWRALADRRQWSELFASLLEDTGVLFHDRNSCDYDRRIANLKHLIGGLQRAGYQSNLDMFELLEMFEIADDDEDESDDYQPQETDEPRVQIMTVFAAKGLEYPVVFVAGGFTDDSRRGISYRNDAQQLVFDIPYILGNKKARDPRDKRIDDARLEEYRRLSYVALTRAQFKLYLPMMEPRRSAMKCAVAKALTPAIQQSAIGSSEWGTIAEPADNTATPLRQAVADVAEPKRLAFDALLPEFDSAIGRRRTVVQSFTGLHRATKREQADAFGDKPERVDEVVEAIAEPSDPFRGPVFGEMVHEIFERVDFAAIRAAGREADLDGAATMRLIDEQIPRFLPRLTTRAPDEALFAGCRRVMRSMVWNALKTPLTPLGGRLCELAVGDRLQEIEFLYPESGDRSGDGSVYYKGFIDLVFRWNGAIYLLDWKTNALPGYDRVNLEAAMADAGYRLQYELYWEALTRWLGRSAGKYRMGGVLYLFLRGMNGVDDSSGVYFVPAQQVQSRSRRDG